MQNKKQISAKKTENLQLKATVDVQNTLPVKIKQGERVIPLKDMKLARQAPQSTGE